MTVTQTREKGKMKSYKIEVVQRLVFPYDPLKIISFGTKTIKKVKTINGQETNNPEINNHQATS